MRCQEAIDLLGGCDHREMGDLFHRFQALSLKKSLFDDYRNFVTALSLTFSEDDQVVQQSLQAGEKIVFEGSQGALIDCDYGFWPFVTKTPTTVKAARELLARHGIVDEAFYLGIIRAYSYRHGPGPLVPEEPLLDTLFPESHNREGPWQGPVRRGWFDVLASRYALAINDHIDGLAVTHLDRIGAAGMVKLCTSYHYGGEPGDEVEHYFKSGGRDDRRITMLKPRHNGRSPDYSQKLLQCSPLDYLEFSGIPSDPRPGAGMHSPPLWLEHFIHFIESPDGLDVPVVVQSYGPGAEDKKVMKSCFQGGIS